MLNMTYDNLKQHEHFPAAGSRGVVQRCVSELHEQVRQFETLKPIIDALESSLTVVFMDVTLNLTKELMLEMLERVINERQRSLHHYFHLWKNNVQNKYLEEKSTVKAASTPSIRFEPPADSPTKKERALDKLKALCEKK